MTRGKLFVSMDILCSHSSFSSFLQGRNQSFDLPTKKRSDICTIMYTSGTTGDPKGVMISNESIITILAGINAVLGSRNEQVITFLLLLLDLNC